MKKLHVFVASVAICICLSIGASGQGNSQDANRGKPSPTPTPVPTPTPTPAPNNCGSDVTNLSLNVELGGYQIIPDTGGAYTTTPKVRGVSTSVAFQIGNCSHDLVVNLNSSPRYMDVIFPGDNRSYRAKFYNFDRIASVPVTTTADFMTSTFCTTPAWVGTGFVVPRNSDGTYKDNYAGCGSDAGGNFVRRNVGIGLDDGTNTTVSLRFQNSPYDGGTNAGNTSYIKVYHPTATTWVLEPETPSTGVRLRSSVPEALFTMPFRFSLTRLP